MNIFQLESRVLFATGALDNSFGKGGITSLPQSGGSNYTEPLALPGGKLLVAGTVPGSGGHDVVLLRYSANGKLDTSFDGDGILQRDFGGDDRAAQIAFDSNGKVMLLGSTAGKTMLARFDVSASGKIDKAYAINGATAFAMSASVPTASHFVIRPDNKVILAGKNVLSRRYANATLDAVFGKGGIATLAPVTRNDYDFVNVDIEGLARLNSGDLIVYSTAGSAGSYMQKISAGGKLDTSFSYNYGVAWFTAKEYHIGDIAIQKDNKIIIFGNDYDSTCYVYRANPDGTPDKSFDNIQDFGDFGIIPPQTYNAGGRTIAVQSDGKIVLAMSTSGDLGEGTGVARLNADGTVDKSFGNLGGRTVDFSSDREDRSRATGLLIDSNGKIVIAGISSPYDEDIQPEKSVFARLSDAATTAVKTIYGTSGDDQFTVRSAERGRFGLVILRGNEEVAYLQSADFASLRFDVGSGNDWVGVEDLDQREPFKYKILPLHILGGKGDDTFVGGEGADTFVGGSGNDTVDYSLRRENLFLSLDNKANDGAAGEKDNIGADIETILGGSGNDTIIGNPFANKLIGNAGNDTIYGGDGNDTLIGGPGNDSLFGQGGNDVEVQ